MKTAEKKNRFYEETLPEGYREALVIDAHDAEQSSRFTKINVLMNTVLFPVIWFAYGQPRISEIAGSFSVIKCIALIAAYFLYVILHELTHGAVYKLLTKQKLTFGIKPPVAYCGVPGIYAYRVTALLSLAAPFTVFSLIFAAAFFLANDSFLKLLILALSVLHLSGCIGDLYGIGLFLFKFKSPDVLRQDTGPKMIYFIKD